VGISLAVHCPAMPTPADQGNPFVRVGRSRGGAVATVDLASPHNRNALSRRLLAELAAGLAAAGADPAVRMIVLGAEGSVFCSGADLSERLEDAGRGAPVTDGPTLPDVLSLMTRSSTPVVAAVGGAVRAGGIGLVAAADLAVGVSSATFAFTEVRVGVAPAVIAVPAGRVMHPRALARHTLTADVFDAAEAAASGLLTEVVPDGALGQRIDELATAFLEASPSAVGETKSVLSSLRGRPWDEALEMAAAISDRLFSSDDAREGMAAFLEKRRPRWVVEEGATP
jgi:methylglutaconyl-CoA hydratase